MAEAVKIAIRVRPFNDKEKEQNQKLCIEMVSLTLSFTRDDDSKSMIVD